MELAAIGRLIAQGRRAKRLTLSQLAAQARVGRSTLAALEAGKLPELGLSRVSRLCAAVDLVIEARPLRLDAPLMAHRHLTNAAGRELTKAAMDDILTRGDITAWRALVRAIRADETGQLPRRLREVTAARSRDDPRARAFSALLPALLRPAKRRSAAQ